MTPSQRKSLLADKSLNVTASIGNSMWMTGFVGSLAFPPLGAVATLGGAIFLTSKIIKAVNNLVVRSNLSKVEKEKLKTRLKDAADKQLGSEVGKKLQEVLQDPKALRDPQNMNELRTDIELFTEFGEDLIGVLDDLEKYTVHAEEMRNGLRDGIIDVINIVNFRDTYVFLTVL